MGSRAFRRWSSLLLAAGLVLVGPAPTSAAQDASDAADPPPLGSGWREVVDAGGELAGTPEQGFVLLGGNDFDDPITTAYYSVDGVTWERIAIETPTGEPWAITSVAVSEAGFVAVSPSPGDEGEGPFLSVAENGHEWDRVDPAALPAGLWPHTVVGGPGGFVIQAQTPNACPSTTSMWFSATGRDWVGSDAPIGGCSVVLTTSSASGWHLVGDAARVASSADGMSWNEVAVAEPIPADALRFGGALAVSGDTWVVSTFTAEPPGSSPGLWVSTDGGLTWAEAPVQAPVDGPSGDYQSWSWTVTDLGFIGVGLIEDLTDADRGFVLFSPDGREWQQFVIDGCCRSIVANGDMLIGAGSGVYTWSPEPSQLPVTGSRRATDALLLGLALVLVGSAALGAAGHVALRRLPARR